MNRAHGFTLLEVSIVLAIIGLLVGAIMVGSAMIQAAHNHSTVSQIGKLSIAITTFKIKFNCLPGDCADATASFPGATNGSGGGAIDGWFGVPTPDQSTNCGSICTTIVMPSESTNAFDHLARANLIPLSSFNSTDTVTNLRPNKGWMTVYNDAVGLFIIGFYGVNYIKIGGNAQFGAGVGSTISLNAGYISPYSASYIDAKIDDGAPRTGRVQNITEMVSPQTYTWTALCSSATAYLTSDTVVPQCGLYIASQF